jgi:peptidoglycan hydrolase-like protein with peptidoglycan-binding domain
VDNGPDVKQLDRALHHLGYGSDMTVDDKFTWETTKAVRAWQKDNGLKQTGRVDAAQVVFLPSPVRITSAKIAVGDPIHPGRQALTVTSTKRVVHIDLKADQQELAKPSAPATIQIPGGGTAHGKIVSVGTVAKKAAGAQSGQSPEPTVEVDIELTDARQVGRLDQAPVTVTLERQHRSNVLSVPVEALLALREGGFGVEVIEPGGVRRIVAVTTGGYGNGRVEISGAGLTPGMKVGVAAE